MQRIFLIFSTFLNGVVFGTIQLVPGVSAGTVAVILGFYDRLLESVSRFTEDWRRHLKFLAPFLCGAALGALAFSSVIRYLLTNYSLPVMSFFIGLISGVIPHIYEKSKEPGNKLKFKRFVLAVFPAALLILISHFRVPAADPAGVSGDSLTVYMMVYIFFAGILSAAALVIPGLSGSFVLLLMGVYYTVVYAVADVRLLLVNPADIELWGSIFKVAGPFALGVFIGGAATARLVGKLLKNHPKTVYSVIFGLMVGSVYALINEPIVLQNFQNGVPAAGITAAAAAFLAGGALSFIIGGKRL